MVCMHARGLVSVYLCMRLSVCVCMLFVCPYICAMTECICVCVCLSAKCLCVSVCVHVGVWKGPADL